MLKRFISLFILFSVAFQLSARAEENGIWEIGTRDHSPEEFALAPGGFRDFLKNDFGFEDKYFIVGHSDIRKDFPYVLAGPADTWGGTWPTSGWRTHEINILFDMVEMDADSQYKLKLNLLDYSKIFLPLVKVYVNDFDTKVQIETPEYPREGQVKPHLMQPIVDTASLCGDYAGVTPYEIEIPVEGRYLHEGGNHIKLSILEGSWILFDNIVFSGKGEIKKNFKENVFVRKVEAAPYQLLNGKKVCQPLIVDVEHLGGRPELEVKLDGKSIFKEYVEQGRYQYEVPMPKVKKERSSKYEIFADGALVASGKVVRRPQPMQTMADYVDTRIGTAHSRWMIAPGPWMPFSMVKMSPDNQMSGWQSGYQPSIENLGCFSHIHEWTLSGLGIMATNGELITNVGDELLPDDGYRSRVDRKSEKAGIGYYAIDLTDYDIKAEVSATTRCSMEQFTFPTDRGNGRVLIELRPEAENQVELQQVEVKKVSDRRIEGTIHQIAFGVWGADADQDNHLHFVMEFDQPMLSLGSWNGGKILRDVEGLSTGETDAAGLFAEFDPKKNPVVKVRTGISLVSVENAAENLEKEMAGPFGWDFNAVVQNQKDTWNDIFDRLTIKTNNRLEKIRFYNNMYRSLCSRNTWSDVNGEWVSTDGLVRKVNNPETDVMLGCDAFWNSFWNLNQLWNLVTPEWSGKWVRSQLAMYDANGWLAKGPAGMNYVPVMVAEHEIPLIVGAYQMGIRDFDAEKALEACVKMQTTPSQKVYNGYAGNRDLETYMKHGYVAYDEGRFSNTMEYSYDDWTVGQLAKALGNEEVYKTFNDRGYWWKNVISKEGYCTMKDSKGNWLPDFDPFRSGANQHYVEGNAWQLTFFVPQDIPALVDMIGKDRFNERLEWGFHQDEPWRYNAPNDQYWDHPVVQGNQQSMHFAYLFNFSGKPWNTQRWSRSILERYYGTGMANAYLGDEDQGQMSAWAVMTQIGLFQMDGGCRVNPVYEIGSPAFEEIVIDLGERYGRGKKFVISAENASRKNVYVQSAYLNGKELNSFHFPASELLKGGKLELVMGPEPNKAWGNQ